MSLDREAASKYENAAMMAESHDSSTAAELWEDCGKCLKMSKDYPKSIDSLKRSATIYEKLNRNIKAATIYESIFSMMRETFPVPDITDVLDRGIKCYGIESDGRSNNLLLEKANILASGGVDYKAASQLFVEQAENLSKDPILIHQATRYMFLAGMCLLANKVPQFLIYIFFNLIYTGLFYNLVAKIQLVFGISRGRSLGYPSERTKRRGY